MPHENEAHRALTASEEGRHLLASGEHEKSLELFTKAARIFGQIGDAQGQTFQQKTVADIHLLMKHPEKAP